jgi:hypothetical protein
MNLRPLFVSILITSCFAGCATFSDAELGRMRQRGVSPVVVDKMQDGRALRPQDVIELTRRGVADDLIVRQIQDTGLDYILSRDDFKRLQSARVSRPVMDALIAASDDFASEHAPSRPRVYAGYNDYYYDGPYYGPYPYYYPYPYGGVSVEIGGGRYWGHRHYWH